MIYLSWKTQLASLVKKHFPGSIGMRFTFRSDSEVFLPKEDKSIWERWKADQENMHILFDGLEILELTPKVPKMFGEVFLLRAFRAAIKDGRISIEKKIEWVDADTAKRNKREKKAKRKKQVEDSFKFALQNKDKSLVEVVEKALPKSKKKKRILKLLKEGGE